MKKKKRIQFVNKQVSPAALHALYLPIFCRATNQPTVDDNDIGKIPWSMYYQDQIGKT
jgi:hypothetical protein